MEELGEENMKLIDDNRELKKKIEQLEESLTVAENRVSVLEYDCKREKKKRAFLKEKLRFYVQSLRVVSPQNVVENNQVSNFDEEFYLTCKNLYYRLTRNIYSLRWIVNFFICVTVEKGFNYVSKSVSRDKYAYYLDGKYYDDNFAANAVEMLTKLIMSIRIELSKDNSIDPIEKIEKGKDLYDIKEAAIRKYLKSVPSLKELDNDTYRDDFRKRYSMSQYEFYPKEEYLAEQGEQDE